MLNWTVDLRSRHFAFRRRFGEASSTLKRLRGLPCPVLLQESSCLPRKSTGANINISLEHSIKISKARFGTSKFIFLKDHFSKFPAFSGFISTIYEDRFSKYHAFLGFMSHPWTIAFENTYFFGFMMVKNSNPDIFFYSVLKLISFSSVISSTAYLMPSRPIPLIFTPPYGIWSTRKVGISLIMTPPTSSFFAA